MPDETMSPETHRNIQTRDGVAAIPREQKGVPLTEYFQNAELPDDLDRAVVYATPSGPVLARPDPVAWSATHTQKAASYAAQIKSMIDEKGYYSKTLSMYARRLADETGHSREEMKAVIVKAFEQEHGKDPFKYLQERRELAGLPVRERTAPEHNPEQ